MKVEIGVKFEPRDLWVGLFWNYHKPVLKLYFCLVPCVPLIIEIER